MLESDIRVVLTSDYDPGSFEAYETAFNLDPTRIAVQDTKK